MKRRQHFFSDIIAKKKMHNLNLIMEKHQAKSQLKNILQGNWFSSSKIIQIRKGKHRLNNCFWLKDIKEIVMFKLI